jgi:hypothetical protein
MDFTFWESKSVKLPMGPLYASGAFIAAVGILVVLGQWAGSLVQQKEVKFSGPTLEELQVMEKTATAGEPTKINEMLQKDGGRIGADMSKWGLVSKWNNPVLFDLFKEDLLFNLRGQIKALQAQLEAMKAKPAAAEPATPAAGGETKAAAPPAKQ